MGVDKLSQFSFGYNVVSLANRALKSPFEARIHPKDVNKIIIVNGETKKAVIVKPVLEDKGANLETLGSQLTEAVGKLLY